MWEGKKVKVAGRTILDDGIVRFKSVDFQSRTVDPFFKSSAKIVQDPMTTYTNCKIFSLEGRPFTILLYKY